MKYVIDKDALAANAAIIIEKAKPVPVIGVVKGNGYGLGTVAFAKALTQCGVNFLAVACIQEAQALRAAGLVEPVLLLTPAAAAADAEAVVALDLIACVDSLYSAGLLDTAAGKKAARVNAHIKIDTGLGRYGFQPGEESIIAQMHAGVKNIDFTGIYSHFSSSFSPNRSFVENQLNKFNMTVKALENEGINCGLKHIANSSALLKYPSAKLDAVRVGSAFLGRLAVPNTFGLKKIGYMACEIAAVKDLPKNHNIGYGDTYKTTKPMRIAIVPIGHTNGYAMEKRKDCYRFRDVMRYIVSDAQALIKKEPVFCMINGKSVPVISRVGLTHTVVDVTGVKCSPGDTAVFEINPLHVDSLVERVFV